MTQTESLINGLVGTVASISAFLAVSIADINATLQLVSLTIGIGIGLVTLFRFYKYPPKP